MASLDERKLEPYASELPWELIDAEFQWEEIGAHATDALEYATEEMAERCPKLTREEAAAIIYHTLLQRWDVVAHEKP